MYQVPSDMSSVGGGRTPVYQHACVAGVTITPVVSQPAHYQGAYAKSLSMSSLCGLVWRWLGSGPASHGVIVLSGVFAGCWLLMWPVEG